MYARMSRFAGLPPERIDQTLRQFEEEELPALEQQPGFEGILVLVDRGGGAAAAITLWESQENLRASEELAERAREKAMDTAQLQPRRDPVIDRYEVVMRK